MSETSHLTLHRKEEHREVANGSTLVSVLRATAAPMGGVLSSFAQAQSRLTTHTLSAQGLSGEPLKRLRALQGLHAVLLLAFILAIGALDAMSFGPKRRAAAPLARTRELNGNRPMKEFGNR